MVGKQMVDTNTRLTITHMSGRFNTFCFFLSVADMSSSELDSYLFGDLFPKLASHQVGMPTE